MDLQPSDQQNPEVQPPQKTSSKKLVVIIVAAIIVMIGCVVAVVLLMNQPAPVAPAGSDRSAFLYDRPGYNRKDLASSIGDPMALSLGRLAAGFKATNSTNIVPACNVLTIDDFTQQKLYLGANSLPTVITRTYIDGVGKAPLDPSEYTLPSTGDANKCFYTLEQSDGFVGVTVYQPPLVANGAVQDTLSRSYAPTTVAGLDSAVRVFKNTKNRDGETTYMLQIGDVSAEVLLRIGQSKATDSLLQLASKNIMSLQKNAQGVAPANYNSPTFKKSVVRACDLMSNDDIKSLTGNDASQFVDESLATATGVVSQANSDGSFQYYNYIQNSCDRYNSGIGSGLVRGQAFDQKLDVTATSFQDDQGAKNGFASTKKGAANAVAAKVGDEALGYKDSAGQNTMVLRQGRFIIEMVFNRTLQRNGLENTATMTEKLTPYAQSVAGRLKEFDKGL